MLSIPDDPIVHSMETTGYPPWESGCEAVCPVCGQACVTIYKDFAGDIVGCDECLTPCDAEHEEECYPGWDG